MKADKQHSALEVIKKEQLQHIPAMPPPPQLA